MKLDELVIDVDDLPDIQESMSARFDDLVWSRPSKLTFLATGRWKDETLNLAIDLVSFSAGRKYVLAQLSFERIIDGKPKAGILNLNKDTFPILGAVANAFRDKLKHLSGATKIDAVFGLAVNGEEDKVRLFKRLLTGGLVGLAMRTSAQIKNDEGTVVLGTNENLSAEEWADLEEKLKSMGKISSE